MEHLVYWIFCCDLIYHWYLLWNWIDMPVEGRGKRNGKMIYSEIAFKNIANFII